MQEPSNPALSPAWRPRADVEAQAAQALTTHLGCPLAIAQVLVARGIDTAVAADAFLNPTLEDLLDSPATSPARMMGMNAAVERILSAVRNAEPILIYGDYDVDGTTATVLLKTAIERIGLAIDPRRPAAVSYHVPHRIREGYGMQNAVLGKAAADGVRLVISVDTGIRAIAEASEARALGLDLIVTDHHLPDDGAVPDALAVINPAQPGCPYPNKGLCGAAVAFKLAQALLQAAAPFTPDPGAFLARARGVLLPSFLKLVAIATVADSVPLAGENRAIAALGLAALAHPVQPGLRALMQLAKIPLDRAPTATEVGFRLAPRINAAGRMDIANDVVELLLTRELARASELAQKLDRLNEERRASEARALNAIDTELQRLRDGNGEYPCQCLVLDHPEWHRGVLGILASRVVERTGRPALIVTHADGDAYGSGRSVPGFHLLDAIGAADAADPAAPLFHRFGGHAHAVGFSLPSDRLPLLRARIDAYALSRLTPELLVPHIEYDAELRFADITPGLMAWIARCAPFGVGNPEPVFLTRDAVLAAPIRSIQERHIGLQLMQYDPQPQESSRLKGVEQQGMSPTGRLREAGNRAAIPALGWSRDTIGWPARCAQMALVKGSVIDVLYRLRHNTGPYARPQFDGLELDMRDLRPAASP